MIDFDKLKEAHETLFHLRAKESKHVSLRTVFKSDGDAEYSIGIGEAASNLLNGEDELIAYLKELTKPEPKYKLNQRVWVAGLRGGLHKTAIKQITDNGMYRLLGHFDLDYSEAQIYPTRQALIESQINYWMALYHYEDKEFIADTSKVDIEETKELFKEAGEFKFNPCEHKPDASSCQGKYCDCPKQCEKCGEFYR